MKSKFKNKKWLFAPLLAMVLLSACAITSFAIDASDKYSASPVTTYKGHKYQLVFAQMEWGKANSCAKSIGGHLATITSAGEQNFIWNFVNKWKNIYTGSYWLGGTDQEQEGWWEWVTGERFSYTHWSSGEPNNQSGQENYLELGYYSDSDAWNDRSDRALGFIVEWDGYLTSYQLNFTSIQMTKGGTVTLNLIKQNPYGFYTTLTYSSSNKKVATVSKSGKITAKKKGNARITVTLKSNGKKYTRQCEVTVS